MESFTDQIAAAIARYQYATIPLAPRGAPPEQFAAHAAELDDLFAGPVLGIEITDSDLAARCSLGNADPQHGCHLLPPGREHDFECDPWEPGYGAGYFPAAWTGSVVRWAHNAVNVAPEGATLVTSRADLDSVCAMALLALHARGVVESWCLSEGAALALRLAVAERVAAVHAADCFDMAQVEWTPTPLPTPDAPWGDERGPVDCRRAIAAINAAVQDAAMPLATRVEWAAWWLATSEEPEGYRARVEATRMRLVEQITPESVRLDASGRIALIEVDHPGAVGLGYYLAPIVVARVPHGPIAGKFTIAAWGDRIDHAALRRTLRERDGKAWGGPPTLTAYGPPTNGDTSPQSIEEVAAVVVAHLRGDPRP